MGPRVDILPTRGPDSADDPLIQGGTPGPGVGDSVSFLSKGRNSSLRERGTGGNKEI